MRKYVHYPEEIVDPNIAESFDLLYQTVYEENIGNSRVVYTRRLSQGQNPDSEPEIILYGIVDKNLLSYKLLRLKSIIPFPERKKRSAASKLAKKIGMSPRDIRFAY